MSVTVRCVSGSHFCEFSLYPVFHGMQIVLNTAKISSISAADMIFFKSVPLCKSGVDSC